MSQAWSIELHRARIVLLGRVERAGSNGGRCVQVLGMMVHDFNHAFPNCIFLSTSQVLENLSSSCRA